MTTLELTSFSMRYRVEQVFGVRAGAEDILDAVPDAGRHRPLGEVKAPGTSDGDAVIDPAVDATDVGRSHPLEIALLGSALVESTSVRFGKLVVGSDLDAACLDGCDRLLSNALDQGAVGVLAARRRSELGDVASSSPARHRARVRRRSRRR